MSKIEFPEPVVKIELMTEEFLNSLIARNTSNRPIRRHHVSRIAMKVLTGVWDFNGASITVDKYGATGDGQHRAYGFLEALRLLREDTEDYYSSLAGMTVEKIQKIQQVVVYGVSPKAANTNDIGQPLSQADVIFRQRFWKDKEWTEQDRKTMAQIAATTAKMIHFRLNYGEHVRASRKFEHETVLQVLGAHPGILDYVQEVYLLDKESKGNIRRRVSPAYIAGVAYLGTRDKNWELCNVENMDKFLNQLTYGTGTEISARGFQNYTDPTTSPTYVLREYLTKTKENKDVTRNGNTVVDWVVNAWNAFAAGKMLSTNKTIKAADRENVWSIHAGDLLAVDTDPESYPLVAGGMDQLPIAEEWEEQTEEQEETGEVIPEGEEVTVE